MSQEHNDQKSGAESMDATFTMLPKNTGIRGSPMLGIQHARRRLGRRPAFAEA